MRCFFTNFELCCVLSKVNIFQWAMLIQCKIWHHRSSGQARSSRAKIFQMFRLGNSWVAQCARFLRGDDEKIYGTKTAKACNSRNGNEAGEQVLAGIWRTGRGGDQVGILSGRRTNKDGPRIRLHRCLLAVCLHAAHVPMLRVSSERSNTRTWTEPQSRSPSERSVSSNLAESTAAANDWRPQ